MFIAKICSQFHLINLVFFGNIMTYEQLKTLCAVLYGRTWKPNLATDLNIKRPTIDNWSSQGCPKWLDDELPILIQKRKDEINALN